MEKTRKLDPEVREFQKIPEGLAQSAEARKRFCVLDRDPGKKGLSMNRDHLPFTVLAAMVCWGSAFLLLHRPAAPDPRAQRRWPSQERWPQLPQPMVDQRVLREYETETITTDHRWGGQEVRKPRLALPERALPVEE